MPAGDPFAAPIKSETGFSTKPSRGSHMERPSRSFSFSRPDFWRPAKEPILQWIRDIPGPVQHDTPLEPAHYQTLKHALDYNDSEDGSSVEDHRRKRAKMNSPAGSQSVAGSRRSMLIDAGSGLVRRVSNACQRVASSGRHSSASKRGDSYPSRSATPAPEPTPSSGTPSFMLIDRPKMRFVFVGDAGCGKSSLLMRFYRDTFTQHYAPTQYELFNKVVTVDGQDADVELWDTAGDVTLEQLGRLSYLAWDAVFLCFSVSSMRSFDNARTQWIAQIRRHTRGAPLLLVGTKTDDRVGRGLWAPLYPDLDARVTATEGSMMATELGAYRYVECSAKTGQGIEGLFEDGVRAVFQQRGVGEKLEKSRIDHLSGLAELLCF
ncbi:P-loop containing nucleoside triphosphate hydrolase protein [Xylaria palmicola]|nr:P-loop containing nucleoside triphosphate hydrolase protein [Xylaria palmicola]